MVLVFNPDKAGDPAHGIPHHGARGPGHMGFEIDAEDFDYWRSHLARHRVAIESELDWPNGGHSIYFRDPAGNSIEVLHGLWK